MALYRKTLTRWLDSEGNRTKAGTPGSRKVRNRSKLWYGRYRDAAGIVCEVKLASNKPAAQTMLSDLIREAERGKAGIVDPFAKHAKRPLSEHLADFASHLTAKGNTAGYVTTTVQRVTAIVDGCGFRRIGDISASRVAGWLSDQREADAFGVASSNHYLTAAKAFTKWLVKDRRTGDDRLAHLSRLNAKADIRRQRRALTSEELSRLIEAARTNGDCCGLTGEQRAMLYTVAGYTGLRASELASLTEASFDLKGDPATVVVEAGYSKHRKRDELPVHGDLAQKLRAWFTSREMLPDESHPILSLTTELERSCGPLWPGRWARDRQAAVMLRHDLQAAGIAYVDEQGRQADFHALRHTFISMLAQAGIHPKTAQELARHSDINLTMQAYTHLRTADLASGLSALPSLTSSRETLKATGTTDDAAGNPPHDERRSAQSVVARMVTRADDIRCNSVRMIETGKVIAQSCRARIRRRCESC